MNKLTKEDVALFVMVGGYCPKCKESPQPVHNWGFYCLACWNATGITRQGSTAVSHEEWYTTVNAWSPALRKWAKVKAMKELERWEITLLALLGYKSICVRCKLRPPESETTINHQGLRRHCRECWVGFCAPNAQCPVGHHNTLYLIDL